ncbi:MAG: DUF349 domain-containing protein [Cyclobacteriaceae bacterium]|jgi:hypothetical protein|nr:DUF349 domain-containing protein [Cytophagales bacterium]HNP78216.1 DUF349 domain-containing protein [Cyclobacteriaceae bacterium]
MESNEELVTMKPESEGVDPATSANGALVEIEEALTQDFSNFTKQDYVDLLKDLAHQNDHRKTEAVLREIKSRYDELLDKERQEALKKFVDEGGAVDDFSFRGSELDNTFDANYKLLRDRRAEFARTQEEQKNQNFEKKNHLLEELRALVDGEDNKHSFEKFKEIQQRWKAIGAVPMAQVRPLWASYHALVDRFYDNRNIYFELKELDRKKNLAAKTELCVRAEKLADVTKIGEAIRELNELHEEYKHIGPVSREDQEPLWERFKKASDAVYARRDEYIGKLQQEFTNNLALKQQVIAEIAEFTTFQSDRIKEWNQKTTQIMALQKKWEAIGAVPRAKTKDINKQFWSAFKIFFSNKSGFFKKLDESRQQNLALKKELVAQAEAIKDNTTDWEKTANTLKALQVKWKEIGPVPDKVRESVFQEFKAACDHFFGQRRATLDAADKEQQENLTKKEAICSELERMVNEKTGTLGQLKEMQRSFHAIGFVPRTAMNGIKNRFNTATEKLMTSLSEVSQEEKDKAMLEIQLENMKTDPDASHKLHVREQTLRKQITKAENDLATLKNNLEFFARSKGKNAEDLRADVNQKIEAAAAELAKLKSQLKVLRSAQ